MSRGYGAMQRRIIAGLDDRADEICPERWYDLEGLGFVTDGERPSGSLSTSFRRAANRLAEDGIVQLAQAFYWRDLNDTSTQFRRGAGGRLRLVVRFEPTVDDLKHAVEVHQRHIDAEVRGKVLKSRSWYFDAYIRSEGFVVPWDELKRHGLTQTFGEALFSENHRA